MTRVLTLIFLICTVAGCALSPQLIDIAPQPTVTDENIGHNIAVSVSSSDHRSRPEFGSRGGVYGDTSLIRASNDLTDSIALAARQALQQQGFNAYNPGADANQLDVRVVTFRYTPEDGAIVNRVDVEAELHAVVSNARGDQFRGVYRAGNSYEQPITPSAKRNAMMLNEVLSRALSSLLADSKLQQFLVGAVSAP